MTSNLNTIVLALFTDVHFVSTAGADRIGMSYASV